MYTQHSFMGGIIPKSSAVFTAEDLSAANAVYGGYLIAKQCKVTRFEFYVTTAINTVTPAQVVMKRRPTYNSATGEILLGTINIPTGTAAGTVLYVDILPVVLFPGDELSFEQTAVAGTAGQGFYCFQVELDPETAPNQPKMLKSL